MPVCDINFAIWNKTFDGFAQQGCIVPRHRGHQHNLARGRFTLGNFKMYQISEGAFDNRFNVHNVIAPILTGERIQSPVWFDNHAFERPLGHFAPCCHPLNERIRNHCECWVGGETLRGCPHPLICISHGFHDVITCHMAHGIVLVPASFRRTY